MCAKLCRVEGITAQADGDVFFHTHSRLVSHALKRGEVGKGHYQCRDGPSAFDPFKPVQVTTMAPPHPSYANCGIATIQSEAVASCFRSAAAHAVATNKSQYNVFVRVRPEMVPIEPERLKPGASWLPRQLLAAHRNGETLPQIMWVTGNKADWGFVVPDTVLPSFLAVCDHQRWRCSGNCCWEFSVVFNAKWMPGCRCIPGHSPTQAKKQKSGHYRAYLYANRTYEVRVWDEVLPGRVVNHAHFEVGFAKISARGREISRRPGGMESLPSVREFNAIANSALVSCTRVLSPEGLRKRSGGAAAGAKS